MRRRTIQLIEAPNLLVMKGRKVAAAEDRSKNPDIELPPAQIQALIDADPATFLDRARTLQDAAMMALKASDARNKDALFSALERIDKACENCHLHYWYPNDKRAREAARQQDRSGKSPPERRGDLSTIRLKPDTTCHGPPEADTTSRYRLTDIYFGSSDSILMSLSVGSALASETDLRPMKITPIGTAAIGRDGPAGSAAFSCSSENRPQRRPLEYQRVDADSTSIAIFARKSVVIVDARVGDEHGAPVVAVKAKASHVHFRISDAIIVNGRRVDARPSSRRS